MLQANSSFIMQVYVFGPILCYTNTLLFTKFFPLYTAAAYSMLYLFVLILQNFTKFFPLYTAAAYSMLYLFVLTPLDLALLAGHSESSDYLVARGGRSMGGQVYRAVVTLQMAWRFYLHKVHSRR